METQKFFYNITTLTYNLSLVTCISSSSSSLFDLVDVLVAAVSGVNEDRNLESEVEGNESLATATSLTSCCWLLTGGGNLYRNKAWTNGQANDSQFIQYQTSTIYINRQNAPDCLLTDMKECQTAKAII